MDLAFEDLAARDAYKLLTALVVPRPIALLTTLDGAGRVNAAPFSFFNAMGTDPPTVVLGIQRRDDGRLKDTAANLSAGRGFVVNLVDFALAERMNVCATDFPAEWSEPEVAGIALAESVGGAPPRLRDAPASLECLVDEILPRRTFSIVVGRALRAHVRDGLLDAESMRVDLAALDLVGRLAGSGYATTRDVFELRRITFEEWRGRWVAVS